jgi:hypothetical protein
MIACLRQLSMSPLLKQETGHHSAALKSDAESAASKTLKLILNLLQEEKQYGFSGKMKPNGKVYVESSTFFSTNSSTYTEANTSPSESSSSVTWGGGAEMGPGHVKRSFMIRLILHCYLLLQCLTLFLE